MNEISPIPSSEIFLKERKKLSIGQRWELFDFYLLPPIAKFLGQEVADQSTERLTIFFFFFFVHNNQLKMFRNMGSTSQQCHHKYNVLSWVKIRCELMNLVCHANNSSLNQKKKMEKWKVFCQLISFYCCEHHRMFSADQLIKCSYLWHRLRSHYIRISFSTFFFSRSYPSRGTLCKNGKNYLQHKSFT